MVFPGGSEFKASASDAGDPHSIPRAGRYPGEGNGNPLGRLQSMSSQRVRYSGVTDIHACKCVYVYMIGLPRWLSGKESTCQCRRGGRHRFDPWVRKIPWRRAWQPTPVFLPGESHGQRAWRAMVHRCHKESDTTEQLTHAHSSIIIVLGTVII